MTTNNKNQSKTSVKATTEAEPAMMVFFEGMSNSGRTVYRGNDKDGQLHCASFSRLGENVRMTIYAYDENEPVIEATLSGKADKNGDVYYSGKYAGEQVIAFPRLITPKAGQSKGKEMVAVFLNKAPQAVAVNAMGAVVEAKN